MSIAGRFETETEMREQGYYLAKHIKLFAPHYSHVVRAGFRNGMVGLVWKPHLRTQSRQEFTPVFRPGLYEMPWEAPRICGGEGLQRWYYAVSTEEQQVLTDRMHGEMDARGIIRLPVRLDDQRDVDPILRALEGDEYEWRRRNQRLHKLAENGEVVARYDIGVSGRQTIAAQRRGLPEGQTGTWMVTLEPR